MFVVAVNTQLYIYRLEGVQPISQLTYVLSPFALSNDPINCYVAHCDGNLTGCVVVQDVEQQSLTIRILAHRSGHLSCLVMDSAARRLATSSSRGTVIRVFTLPSGQLLHQFRRGLTAVLLCSLVFSPDAHCIVTVSERGSVHIFQLKNSLKDKSEASGTSTPSTWRSVLAGVFGNVLPRSLTSLVSTVTGMSAE
ncbi:hypothetical protein RvY_03360-3 [Ramazzottius varieornatus]|uniref:WD repeat domain phosphoinositide-interacting protein 2 n=1 Tax=Ramazzottius varieornatus TaxID=947166 RepID=A0A1D1UY18_RAMVA|nr:hypothetical protein RvY_03360-3 [Ramazzottius varieornatus]